MRYSDIDKDIVHMDVKVESQKKKCYSSQNVTFILLKIDFKYPKRLEIDGQS